MKSENKRVWVNFGVTERKIAHRISDEADLRGLSGEERLAFQVRAVEAAMLVLRDTRPTIRELERKARAAARAAADAALEQARPAIRELVRESERAAIEAARSVPTSADPTPVPEST